MTVKTDANREAINAIGEKLAGHEAATREEFRSLWNELSDHRQETRSNFRSVDEQLVEIKDLIVGRLGGQDE